MSATIVDHEAKPRAGQWPACSPAFSTFRMLSVLLSTTGLVYALPARMPFVA